MRIDIWRMTYKEETSYRDQARLKGLLRCQSLKALRQAVWRLVKGDLGMRLDIWRVAKIDALSLEKQRKLNLRMQAGAYRQLRQVMWRMVRGSMSMRVDIWRVSMAAALSQANQGRLKALMKRKALQQIRDAMWRMVRGDMSMRINIWRYDTVEALQVARELKVRSLMKGKAMRELRQIMWRMVRGEMGMRIDVWRVARMDALSHEKQMTLMLRMQEGAHHTRSGALKYLRSTFWQAFRGDVSMRIDRWRLSVQARSIRGWEDLGPHRHLGVKLAARLTRAVIRDRHVEDLEDAARRKGLVQCLLVWSDQVYTDKTIMNRAGEDVELIAILGHEPILKHPIPKPPLCHCSTYHLI